MRKQRRTKGLNQTEKTVTVAWRRSVIGRPAGQKRTVRSLGLKRLHQTLTLPDRPEIRGMIHRVGHLLEVSEGSLKGNTDET